MMLSSGANMCYYGVTGQILDVKGLTDPAVQIYCKVRLVRSALTFVFNVISKLWLPQVGVDLPPLHQIKSKCFISTQLNIV